MNSNNKNSKANIYRNKTTLNYYNYFKLSKLYKANKINKKITIVVVIINKVLIRTNLVQIIKNLNLKFKRR